MTIGEVQKLEIGDTILHLTEDGKIRTCGDREYEEEVVEIDCEKFSTPTKKGTIVTKCSSCRSKTTYSIKQLTTSRYISTKRCSYFKVDKGLLNG